MNVVERRASMLGGDLIMAAGVGLLLLGLLYASRRYASVGSRLACSVAVVLIALELVPFNRSFQVYLPQTRIEQLFPDRPSLREMAGQGRVFPGGNSLVPLSVRSTGGYHAAKPAVTDYMQSLMATGDLTVIRQTAVTVFELEGPPLSYATVRELMLQQMPEADSALATSQAALLPEEPMPRVFFAGDWCAVSDDDLPGRVSLGIPPEDMTYLDCSPEGLGGEGPIPVGTAEIVGDLPEAVTIETENTGTGLLILADTWYPRWRVRIDGEEAPLLRANLWQRAVVVPAGSHTIEFRFDSSDVGTGLIISMITLLAVAVTAVVDRLRTGKNA
jgi:hypothetical protein